MNIKGDGGTVLLHSPFSSFLLSCYKLRVDFMYGKLNNRITAFRLTMRIQNSGKPFDNCMQFLIIILPTTEV